MSHVEGFVRFHIVPSACLGQHTCVDASRHDLVFWAGEGSLETRSPSVPLLLHAGDSQLCVA